MKIRIYRKDIEDARNRMALILAHMQDIEPNIALNYFVTLNVLDKLLTEGEVKFSDDNCIYNTIQEELIIIDKEKEDARGEEQVAGEVPGHISGTDEQNQGDKDGQKEVASDSAD